MDIMDVMMAKAFSGGSSGGGFDPIVITITEYPDDPNDPCTTDTTWNSVCAAYTSGKRWAILVDGTQFAPFYIGMCYMSEDQDVPGNPGQLSWDGHTYFYDNGDGTATIGATSYSFAGAGFYAPYYSITVPTSN